MTATNATALPQPTPDDYTPGTDGLRPVTDEMIAVGMLEDAEWKNKFAALKIEQMKLEAVLLAVQDIRRLKEITMEFADQIARQRRGLLLAREDNAMTGRDRDTDTMMRQIRLDRAVRQLIVLEHEVLGLRPVPVPRAAAANRTDAPAAKPAADASRPKRDIHTDLKDREPSDIDDYDDVDDIDDYDDGPIEEVVAGVRQSIGLDPKPPRRTVAVRPSEPPQAEAQELLPRSALSPDEKYKRDAWFYEAMEASGDGFKERGPP